MDPKPSWNCLDWQGLHFRNRVGIAGGVDKNARNLKAWSHIGYGFLEVGTITPRAQTANPEPNIQRSWAEKIMWNKLGFPNEGAQCIKSRLQAFQNQKKTPIFVNIGKNRDTPNERAQDDYVHLIREFHTLADAFVVNISSPNTQDLRELLKKENLKKFLAPLKQAAKLSEAKLLLKLSPDMNEQEISDLIEVSLDSELNGWILTNSTVARPGEENGPKFPVGGGFTGSPLQTKSREILKKFLKTLGNEKNKNLVISVGGILNYDEMKLRIDLGADLVQVYSALVFEGPQFVKQLRHRHTA